MQKRVFAVFLALLLLFGSEVLLLQFGYLGPHIGQHEEVGVFAVAGQRLVTLVGHLHRLLLLVDDEVERVGSYVHVLLLLLEVELFGLLQTHLDTRFAQELD